MTVQLLCDGCGQMIDPKAHRYYGVNRYEPVEISVETEDRDDGSQLEILTEMKTIRPFGIEEDRHACCPDCLKRIAVDDEHASHDA